MWKLQWFGLVFWFFFLMYNSILACDEKREDKLVLNLFTLYEAPLDNMYCKPGSHVINNWCLHVIFCVSATKYHKLLCLSNRWKKVFLVHSHLIAMLMRILNYGSVWLIDNEKIMGNTAGNRTGFFPGQQHADYVCCIFEEYKWSWSNLFLVRSHHTF